MSRMILRSQRRQERPCGRNNVNVRVAWTIALITWSFVLLQCSCGWCANVLPSGPVPRHFQPGPNTITTGVAVPDLRGMTLAQANGALASVRLQVGKVVRRIDNRPPGTVVDQRPGPRTMVLPGTKVDLQIAVRAAITRVAVPDLTGQTEARARNTLTRAGLQAGAVSQRADRRPPGTIVGQNPGAGAMVLPGTPVDLWLAAALHRVLVPDLAGLTLKQAKDKLSGVGLLAGRISEQRSDRPNKTVIGQDPPSGTLVKSKTTVDLVVSALTTEPVPNPSNGKTTNAPFKWIAVLGGLLATLGGGYLGVRRTVRRKRWLKAVRLRPAPDKGVQQLVLEAPLHPDWEVRLKPVKDPGQQTIESPGALVLGERGKS